MIIARLIALTLSLQAADPQVGKYFQIKVIDEQTGRGVPLVELTTTNSIRYYTDSNGLVAFYEPGLMNRRVFFNIKSHGYEFAKDGFGIAGKAIETVEGGSVTLKIKRVNIAERLYRITGQGIYADTIRLGQAAPTTQPVLNGQVMGSDSIQTTIYKDKIYWFWGDTGSPFYPLGNFQATGATSDLPGQGGLDPDIGIDLHYFVGKEGFARKMAPMPQSNPVWLDGPFVLPDETGRDRMYTYYARVTQSMETIERGLVRWNDDKEEFEKVVAYDLKSPVKPAGHVLRHTENGTEYLLFVTPFPHVRVQANIQSILDIANYESYTCLKDGSRLDSPMIDRNMKGEVRYAWRKNTPTLDTREQEKLIKDGTIKNEEVLVQLRDANTGKTVVPHSGSVFWNAYRGKWITIRCEFMGTTMVGETWYAEADTPIGPWVYARKIVTHDRYDFYNPRQHPMFDRDGGKIIYFEGTYTASFSGNTDKTPRYEYNQIMYKLNLDDPRLVLPSPVYDLSPDGAGPLRMHAQLPLKRDPLPIAFFAADRPAPELVAVAEVKDGKSIALKVGANGNDKPIFYAVAADAKNPPAATTPLYEYAHKDGVRRLYSVNESLPDADYTRSKSPLCRVWKNPSRLTW